MTMASSARAPDVEVLFDEQDRDRLRRLLRVGDFGDDLGARPFVGLVDEENAVVVEERGRRPTPSAAGRPRRPRGLAAPRDEVGEELGDEVAPRILVALGEGEVLGDAEAGEHFAVLGRSRRRAARSVCVFSASIRSPPA
jgi:hypothetical protein